MCDRSRTFDGIVVFSVTCEYRFGETSGDELYDPVCHLGYDPYDRVNSRARCLLENSRDRSYANRTQKMLSRWHTMKHEIEHFWVILHYDTW